MSLYSEIWLSLRSIFSSLLSRIFPLRNVFTDFTYIFQTFLHSIIQFFLFSTESIINYGFCFTHVFYYFSDGTICTSLHSFFHITLCFISSCLSAVISLVCRLLWLQKFLFHSHRSHDWFTYI